MKCEVLSPKRKCYSISGSGSASISGPYAMPLNGICTFQNFLHRVVSPESIESRQRDTSQTNETQI